MSLHSTARSLDRLLLRTSHLLHTPLGLTSSLSSLFYLLALVHSQLTRLLEQRYASLAESIATKASQSMLPGETLVATIEPPNVALRSACMRTSSAKQLVLDARLILRLKGLLDIYASARQTYDKPSRDAVIKSLAWAQMAAKAMHQFFENAAFLTNKGVLGDQSWRGREAAWWKLSARWWLVQISLEALRLLRVRQLKFNEELGAESNKIATVQSEELERRWTRQLIANTGWIIPAWNWSVQEEGLLPAVGLSPNTEAWFGASGLLSAVLELQNAQTSAS